MLMEPVFLASLSNYLYPSLMLWVFFFFLIVLGRIIASPKYPYSNPQNILPYIPKGLANAVRIRILRWGNYPGLSGWTQCNHKGTNQGETVYQGQSPGCDNRSRGWRAAGCWAEERMQALEPGKDQEGHGFSPWVARRNTVLWKYDFWPPELVRK